MKQPNALLKLAVVASSVLLVGGFVSYQAGAFDWLLETSDRSAEAGSSPTLDKNSSDSSKAGKNSAEPDPSTQPPRARPQRHPTLMPGSKSFTPNNFVRGLTPAETSAPDKWPPAAAQPEPTLMLGPKSGIIFRPPPDKPGAKAPSPSQPSKPAP